MAGRWWIATLLFLGALALYVRTLCPDLYWFDSAEFVNDAVLLDIPHSPGYPLFNLLAHAFTRLPFGTVAARVNLFSAVVSAATVAAVFLAAVALGVPRALSAAAAALVAVSRQFWELSVVAEVYGLEALFIATALALITRFEESDRPVSAARALPLAVVMGAALFHRPTALFFLAGWIALFWRRLARPFTFLCCMGLGALPYLHTAWVFFTRSPGSAQWSINYSDFPRTVETFLRICTGTLYAGNLGPLSARELATEVRAYMVLARDQLSSVVVGLALLGLLRLARERGPRRLAYVAVLLAGNVGFFLFYNALEKDTMYVPSFLALTWLALLATEELWGRPLLRRGLAVLVAALALRTGIDNGPRIDRRDYHEVRRAVDSTARLLPERAWFYLTDDLIIHPFLHVMILEGVRTDVKVQIVDGFGPAVKEGIRDRLARRERVLSPLFYPEATFREVAGTFTLLPRGFLYEVLSGPAPALARQTGGEPAALAGAGLSGVGVFPAARRLRRSDQLRLEVTWDLKGAQDPAVVFGWRPPGLERPLTWTHRIGYQKRPRMGEELTEEYLLKVPWNLPRPAAGAANLTLAVVPSITGAIRAGTMTCKSTQSWEDDVFFKASAAGFVRAIERGWPVYAEFLDVSVGARVPPGADLGTVELVREVE